MFHERDGKRHGKRDDDDDDDDDIPISLNGCSIDFESVNIRRAL